MSQDGGEARDHDPGGNDGAAGRPRAERIVPADVVTDVRPVRHRADFAFMRQRLSRWIALGFGSGLSPVGPGTVGTLFGWALYLLLVGVLGRSGMVILAVAGIFVGVWAIRRTGRDLGEVDSGAIVWDEIVAFWLVLAALPQTLGVQLIAFLLFRLFDVWKPTPIREAERRWPTPLGVMIDDLLAAVYVLAVFLIWSAIQ